MVAEGTAGIAAKAERAVFYLLVLLLLIAPLIMTSRIPVESGKWYVIQVGASILLGLWLLAGLVSGNRRIRWDALSVLAVAFLGTQFLSLIGAINVWDGLEVISKQVGVLAVFLLIANVLKGTNDRNRILWAAALVGGATAIYGIAQHHGYDFFPWEEHKEVPVTRGVSFFGHATFAGSVLIMLIPLTIGLTTVTKNTAGRILAAIIVLLMLYHLSFSGARVATVGLFVAGLVVVGVQLAQRVRSGSRESSPPGHRSRRILAGLAVLLTVVAAGSAFMVRAWDVKGSDLFAIRQSSLALRFYAWETTSRMILDNPVTGIGVGNYGVASPPYWNAIESSRYARHGRRFFQAHNEYLEIAAEQGLPGITVMLGLIAFALTGSYGLAQRAGSAGERRLGWALFAAVVAICIDATVTFSLQNPGSALFFWMLLGLISTNLAAEKARVNDLIGSNKATRA